MELNLTLASLALVLAAMATPNQQGQLRIALHRRGLLPAVEIALASLAEPDKTEAAIRWEYGGNFLRDHPMVAAIGQAVGVSSADLDTLFTEAAAL